MNKPSKAHVAIVQHSIRHYRAPFFHALRQRLSDAGVGLRLIHSNHPEELTPSPPRATLPWAEVRPGRRLSTAGKTLLWQPVLAATRDAQLVVVEQATHLLVNYALLGRQVLGGPPVAFWGHGRNFLLPADGRSLPESAKRMTSLRAHWWFAYNEHAADVVEAMGYPPKRITVVHNATDTRQLAQQIEALDEDEIAAVRREFGLAGTNVGLFIGTLGAVKRFDHLFAAADIIREQVPDFELLITGRGMEQPGVAAWCRDRPWAYSTGPRFGKDLAPLLALAKVLLVPGWAGLVVVDSFAAGVPLVASASGPHPPEIDYLKDGLNGLLVDDGCDPRRYAAAVTELLRDEQRRQALVHGCVNARKELSVEHMAVCFTSGILHALAATRENSRHSM